MPLLQCDARKSKKSVPGHTEWWGCIDFALQGWSVSLAGTDSADLQSFLHFDNAPNPLDLSGVGFIGQAGNEVLRTQFLRQVDPTSATAEMW